MEDIKRYKSIIRSKATDFAKIIAFGLGTFGVLIISLVLFTMLLNRGWIPTGGMPLADLGQIVIYSIVTIYFVIVYWVIFKDNRIKENKKLKEVKEKFTNKYGGSKVLIHTVLRIVLKILIYYLIAMILIYGLSALLKVLNLNETSENQEMIEELSNQLPALYIFIQYVILAPLAEELVFRFGIQKMLLTSLIEVKFAFFSKLKTKNEGPENYEKYRKTVKIIGLFAVIITSIVFAGIHVQFTGITKIISDLFLGMRPQSPDAVKMLAELIAYMPISIIMGIAYWKEESIIYPLAIHILNNLTAFIQL